MAPVSWIALGERGEGWAGHEGLLICRNRENTAGDSNESKFFFLPLGTAELAITMFVINDYNIINDVEGTF